MMRTLYYFYLFLIVSCNGNCSDRNIKHIDTVQYHSFLTQFNSKLVDHFPIKPYSKEYLACSHNNSKTNDIGLFLYNYDLTYGIVDSIQNILTNNPEILMYHSSDSCQLIVNRFLTIESIESDELPLILDSSLIENKCYVDKYPVPRFIDYEGIVENHDLMLSKNFTIYILEAKPTLLHEYNLNPNIQMPKGWKNGFTRGIAISRIDKTIIYFLLIW